MEPDGSRPQTILTTNAGADVEAMITMPDDRLLFPVFAGGRYRLFVAKPRENPAPFIQTTEDVAGPVTMVGTSEVAFVIGSGKSRKVAIASAANGRIVRRLEKADGPSVRALAASPDGTTLYYAAMGKIWAIPSTDGEPQVIHEGDSVSVDPNGQYLIIQLNENDNVRLVRVPIISGVEQSLSFPSVRLARSLMPANAVRGDGTILTTASYSDSWAFSVAVLRPDSGAAQRITWPFFLDTQYAGWTASGQIVAFGARTDAILWRLRRNSQ
jgi:Tol biopolymer transport system component